MIIPVLPRLQTRDQWIAFCRRERPYCFVREPDTLVDMQSTFLILTLLNEQVRDGRQAIKYSIGSRSSLEPAWQFIKACRFDLAYMVNGLEQVNFDGNARDNSRFRAADNVSIRKFFSKEAALISPAGIGPLVPLQHIPLRWSLLQLCQLLANKQYRQLSIALPQLAHSNEHAPTATVDGEALLRQLVDAPVGWSVRGNELRVELWRDGQCQFHLQPDLQLDRLRRPPLV